MMQFVRRAGVAAAVVAALAGCSFGSNAVPLAGSSASAPNAMVSVGSLPPHQHSDLMYSTRIAFRGPDGRRYSGDAIVFPDDFFRGLHPSPQMRAAIASLRKPHGGGLAYYLAIPGVKGTAMAENYGGWSEIDGWSTGYGNGTAGAKPTVMELQVSKPVDVVTPYLLSDLFKGGLLQGIEPVGVVGDANNVVELDVVEAGVRGTAAKIMYLQFSKVRPVIHATSFAAAGPPQEIDTFAYATAVFCVYPQNPDGSIGKAVCSNWTPPGAP